MIDGVWSLIASSSVVGVVGVVAVVVLVVIERRDAREAKAREDIERWRRDRDRDR